MQDPLPAFVLHSGAMMPLDEAPPESDVGEPVPQPLQKRSDEWLMVSFSHGSADAFTELFSRYKQPLFGFFRRRLDDESLAEEATQETFLAVVRASSRYEPRALFRTYLYAIAMKILLVHRRKSAFRSLFSSRGSDDREPSITAEVDTQVLLRNALSKLEGGNREILMLREFEDLSYAEIGELLNLPINTVRSRLFRARMALHDILAAPAPRPATTAASQSEEHP